ncbi:MAG: hypothetical protein M3Q38_00045, partial [Chloroflexota bacterium]|nr:hypothetical protein [Chloroflexota bacterium]
GESGGGGGAGRTGAGTPSGTDAEIDSPMETVEEKAKEIMQCAADQSSKWSIASHAGISADNFFGQTFLGNDAASLSYIITGPPDIALKELPGNALMYGLEKGAQASMNARIGPKSLLDLRQDSSLNYFAHRSYAERFGKTVIGASLRGAAKIWMTGKLVYDAGTYATAAAQCLSK